MPAQSRDLPFMCRRCGEKFLGSLALALHFRDSWGGPCCDPRDRMLELIVLGDEMVWAVPDGTNVVQR